MAVFLAFCVIILLVSIVTIYASFILNKKIATNNYLNHTKSSQIVNTTSLLTSSDSYNSTVTSETKFQSTNEEIKTKMEIIYS